MSILLYITLGIVFALALVFAAIYMENRRHKKRMGSITYRSQREQSQMNIHKKHLAPSGVILGYNEDLVALGPVPVFHKNDAVFELWRIHARLQKMPPMYLFEPYTSGITSSKSTLLNIL